MPSSTQDPATPLEQLLCRPDVWRGRVQGEVSRPAIATGFDGLDAALLQRGWPLGCLIEVCQERMGAVDWYVFGHALKHTSGGIALLNPPDLPFAQGLIQEGIDLERLVIVHTANRADFVQSFVELSSRDVCAALLAWQPQQALSYAQVRKCLLATAHSRCLSTLFRPVEAAANSSPASLRLLLRMQTDHVQVRILKQRGMLQAPDGLIKISLPASWQAQLPYAHLGQERAAALSQPMPAAAAQRTATTLVFPGRRR